MLRKRSFQLRYTQCPSPGGVLVRCLSIQNQRERAAPEFDGKNVPNVIEPVRPRKPEETGKNPLVVHRTEHRLDGRRSDHGEHHDGARRHCVSMARRKVKKLMWLQRRLSPSSMKINILCHSPDQLKTVLKLLLIVCTLWHDMVQGTIITSYCLQGQLLTSHLYFLRAKLLQHTMAPLDWMKVTLSRMYVRSIRNVTIPLHRCYRRSASSKNYSSILTTILVQPSAYIQWSIFRGLRQGLCGY